MFYEKKKSKTKIKWEKLYNVKIIKIIMNVIIKK